MRTYESRLKWARERKGFETAADAAKSLRMPPPTYQAHENGSRGGEKHAERYSRFFGVDLAWLLTGKGSPDGNRIQRRYDDLSPQDQRDMEEYMAYLEERRKKSA